MKCFFHSPNTAGSERRFLRCHKPTMKRVGASRKMQLAICDIRLFKKSRAGSSLAFEFRPRVENLTALSRQVFTELHTTVGVNRRWGNRLSLVVVLASAATQLERPAQC